MQDNKALQAGTSHNLGQNFARAFDVTFQTETGEMAFAWNTSWGVSTRLVGGLVMTHGDDRGLRVPPRLAPTEVVIVPIWKADDERARVLEAAHRLARGLGEVEPERGHPIRAHVDARETMKPGAKYYEWELRGIPLRLELGPRDLEREQVVLVRRDTGAKTPAAMRDVVAAVRTVLDAVQHDMLETARVRREAHSVRGGLDYGAFRELMEGEGGFVYAGWCGDAACEAAIKEDTKATIRVLPDPEFRSPEAPARCLRCGKSATDEALWARAY